MHTRRTRLAVSSILFAGLTGAAVSFSAPAQAGAFYIQEQSTRASGRAFSGEVADTGPESLWWNPASVATTPAEAYGSLSGISPHTSIDNIDSTLTLPVPPAGLTIPVGGEPHAQNPILQGIVGAGGYARPIGDRFAVAVSVNTPFELVTKYRSNSFARFDALKSRLDTADIQVTGAVKALSWVDIGVGVDAVYTSARLTQALPNLVPGSPDGLSNVTGDGWNAGWNIGVLFHPTADKWTVGASYRSSVRHDVSGDVVVSGLLGPLAAANVITHGSANFKTPWLATVGARYPLSPKLTLEAQIQETGWSEFKTINITFPGVNQVFPQNYRDTTNVSVGADYSPYGPILTFRGGVQWSPTPTPDIGRTLRVPDGDRILIAAGAELTFSEHLTVEAAFEYIDVLNSRVNNQAVFFQGTPALTVANYTASVEANAVVFTGGARWKF